MIVLFVPGLRGAGYGKREDGVGVAVTVARVFVTASVARRPNEDRSLAFSTLVPIKVLVRTSKSGSEFIASMATIVSPQPYVFQWLITFLVRLPDFTVCDSLKLNVALIDI